MPKFASFAKDYIDNSGGQIMHVLPNIYMDTKRVLCLKNKKVPYEDFTKMVLRGKTYVPVVCCDHVDESEPVLDLYPVLNVGVAELLTLLSGASNCWNLRFIDWLENNIVIEDWNKSLELVKEWSEKSYLDNPDIILVDSLRSSYIDNRFPAVRRIYTLMCALRVVNPKFYCLALAEVLKLSLFTAPLLVKNKKEIGCKVEKNEVFVPNILYRDTDICVIVALFGLHPFVTRWNAIRYYPHGELRSRAISDCRGIGLSMLASFTIQLFRVFGDSVGYGVREQTLQKSLESTYLQCLGDDYVGRLLREGHQELEKCSLRDVELCRAAGILPVDCGKQVDMGGITVGRGLAEATMLWRYATGADKLKHDFLPAADVSYGSHSAILDVCNSLLIKDVPEMISLAEKSAAKEAVSGLNLEKLTSSYKRELEKKCSAEAESLRSEVEELKKEQESLRGSLTAARSECDSKSETIAKLRAELDDMRAKMRSTYADHDFVVDEESPEIQDTLEEMVEFVNQFRLVIIGGFDTLPVRLEQLGLTNVYCIQSEKAMNGTLVSGDFFCICTRFISHALSYGVEKAYNSQLEQFFRFNGTNAEALLRAYYDFAKSWFAE